MDDQTQAANPFTVWTGLAARAGEMMWPLGQATGVRTDDAQVADPKDRDTANPQPGLMSREKFQAGADSLAAILSYLTALNMQLAASAFRQWIALSNGMLSLASSRADTSSVEQQAMPAHVTATETEKTSSTTADSTARTTRHGAKRTHSRASKNASRPRKR